MTGDGSVVSECHLLLRVKSHAHAGLCTPSRRQPLIFPLGTRCLHPNLGVSIILEHVTSFTIVRAMIFSAFSSSLARDTDTDANQNRFGAWRKARDRRYTIGNLKYPLVARMVLSAIANGIGKGSQSAFDATDKHLIFRRMSGGCLLYHARSTNPISLTRETMPQSPLKPYF